MNPGLQSMVFRMGTIAGGTRLRFVQVICLSALGIALILTFLSANDLIAARNELAQIEAGHLLSAAQLREAAVGNSVTLEGTISRLTPSVHGSLVTFVHKEGSTLYHQFWIDLGRNTPPLAIDVPDGSVRIMNANYDIVNASATETDGYFGFQAGSPVVVVGSLVHDNQGTAIYASYVRGGTYADYVFERRLSGSFLLILDAALALLALLVFELKAVWRNSRPSAVVS